MNPLTGTLLNILLVSQVIISAKGKNIDFLANAVSYFGSSTFRIGYRSGHADGFRLQEKRANVTEISTKPTPTGEIILTHSVDLNHLVFIVLQDGCYMYHATKQEYHDLRGHHSSHAEKLLYQKVAMATSVHEVDHHTLDTMGGSIKAHCGNLPVFRFDLSTST